MTRLRDDLHQAFEHEQSALGDVADARHRLVRSALAGPHRGEARGLQWAAAVAAILIAALVVATFTIAKLGHQARGVPAATPSPTAQASPTPLQQAPDVPASTPLILYHDPADFDQLDGITWDGQTSGRLGAGATGGGNANPQGGYYATVSDIRDRSGNVVGSFLAKSLPIFWADDGVHFCDVVRASSSGGSTVGVLQIEAPGEPPRDVRSVGVFGPLASNAGGPVIVACSLAGDRAVVYQAGGQGIGVVELWVIQLSTGRMIWHGGGGAWIAASHDGRFVALSPAPGQPTKIYGPDGAQAGESQDEVFAFSWDGNLAVVAGSFGAAPSIVDWRTGQTIWTCPNGAFKYWVAFPEPGGSRLAIGVLDPAYPQTGGFAPVDLFVVGSDGVVVFEKKDVTLLQ